MIFINCSWVSTRWQRSVNLHTGRKETKNYTHDKKLYAKNTKIHKTQKAKRKKEENKYKSNKKNIKLVIRRQQRGKTQKRITIRQHNIQKPTYRLRKYKSTPF
jgi:hypothetical protein